MHHLRPAHLFVADVAVGLQYSLEPFQESLRSRPSPAHLKLEHHAASGAAILPEISLMIFASPVVRLHIHRCFIRLNVSAPQQFHAHHSNERNQQLSDRHHPAVERGPADLQARLPLQHGALPIEREMIAILGDHRVDDHSIADQALFDDPCRRRSCDDTPVAAAATALFALDHQHEILGRLHIQLLALLVPDDFGRLATVGTVGLLRRTGDHPFHAGQIRGQGLPSRMLPRCVWVGAAPLLAAACARFRRQLPDC